jgi:hypothetical protein
MESGRTHAANLKIQKDEKSFCLPKAYYANNQELSEKLNQWRQEP